MAEDFQISTYHSQETAEGRERLAEMLKSCPIPGAEVLANLGVFMTPQLVSRILYLDHLYRMILTTQGIIIEFGCRWGQSLALLGSLRGVYEPYNRLRKIVGFDTFTGFPAISPQDGRNATAGAYAVTDGYESFLAEILRLQEQESALPHVKKHEILKGDVGETVERYFAENPETIVALALFDLDLHAPTVTCLHAIQSRWTRGTVLAFDELNERNFPGETLALKEVLGLDRYAIRRFPGNARSSYLVIE